MIHQLRLLLILSLLFWLLIAGPAWLLAGPGVLLDTGVALALCLVPMTATLLWSRYAFAAAPEQQVLAVLGGTSLRLFVAAGGGIALYLNVEALARPAFLFWVIVFYLATLTLEVMVVVRGQALVAQQRPHQPQQPRC
jgi:hypothetical protein